MTHQQEQKQHGSIYQIELQGHLSEQWAEWFDGMKITQEENGRTLLTGHIIDQAALHGLLKKIRDLGLPLISLIRVPSGHLGG